MKTSSACALFMLVLSGGAAAQETPPPEKPAAEGQERASAAIVPLKVQFLLTRHDGERRVASLPYTMTVTAGSREWARLRMGVEVPVFTSVTEGTPKAVQYRSVGVNLDCRADALSEGRYRLYFTVEQSSVFVAEGEKRRGTLADAPLAVQPMFRTFKATLDAILRDGQTQAFTVATDPVNGEQTRVEVSLNVIK